MACDKPFMITEAGWHSNAYFEHSSTPENQSRYVVQLYTHSLAAEVEVMIYWMLHDPGNGYPFKSGLITNVDDPAVAARPEAGIQSLPGDPQPCSATPHTRETPEPERNESARDGSLSVL